MISKLMKTVAVSILCLGIASPALACDKRPPPSYVTYECRDGVLYEVGHWTPQTSRRAARAGAIGEIIEDIGVAGECGARASVRGTAFEDLNANGKRDAGEPTMSGAWLKLSGGGSWFVCAYTGADATYGIPVVDVSGTYIVFPIAPPGWKTTTPVIKTKTVNTTNGFAFLYNDMGFVRDASVKTVEGCDQYNPSRPVPPGT